MTRFPNQETPSKPPIGAVECKHTLRDKSQVDKCFISMVSWLKWVEAAFQLNSSHNLKPSHYKASQL